MTDLETRITNFFDLTNKFYSYNDLKKEFKVKGEDECNLFCDCLNNLVDMGKVYYDNKKGYHAYNNSLNYKFGTLKFNNGNHYVFTDNNEKIIVRSSDLNGALYLDKVIVELLSYNGKFYTGKIKKVIKRNKKEFICKVDIDLNRIKTLVPYNDLHSLNIITDEIDSLNAGDVCKVELINVEDCNRHIGTIKEIIGHTWDDDINLKVYASLNNLNVNFSSKVLKETEFIKNNKNKIIDKSKFTDLTNLPFITISDIKDNCIETAIYVEKVNETYKIIVCTPAIYKYINTDSNIFKEAVKRSVTRHTPYGNINLFPEYITNELCSLKKGTNKYVKACQFIINEKGCVLDYKIYDAIINVHENLTYEQAETYSINNEVLSQIVLMSNMNRFHNENDINSEINYIDRFYDEQNKIENMNFKSNNRFSLIASNIKTLFNSVIVSEYSWLPFIYDNYKNTDFKNTKRIIRVLNEAGFNILNIQNINYKTLKNILSNLQNSDTDLIAKHLIVDAIIKDNEELMLQNNFNIGIDKICNFTSPVNRITDFLLYTIIDQIDNLDYSENGMIRIEKELNKLCTKIFRIKKDNDRINESLEKKRILNYMYDHINERYNAHIVNIDDENLTIQTDNYIDGLIEIKKIHNDVFNYDESTGNIIGKHSKDTYKIGDKIYVISREISRKKEAIFFELLGKQKSLSKKS